VTSGTGTNGVKSSSKHGKRESSDFPNATIRSRDSKGDPSPNDSESDPVQPQQRQPAEIRRAMPVKPLDQEDATGTLLRSAAQPSGDDGHD